MVALHTSGARADGPQPPDSASCQLEREQALVEAAQHLIDSGSADSDAIHRALRAAAIAHLDAAGHRRLSSPFLPPTPSPLPS